MSLEYLFTANQTPIGATIGIDPNVEGKHTVNQTRHKGWKYIYIIMGTGAQGVISLGQWSIRTLVSERLSLWKYKSFMMINAQKRDKQY